VEAGWITRDFTSATFTSREKIKFCELCRLPLLFQRGDSGFTFTRIFQVIWAHFRPFVPETGLCGVPQGKPLGLPFHSLRARFAPLQSPRFVHDRFFTNDRPVCKITDEATRHLFRKVWFMALYTNAKNSCYFGLML
jgi:hypothetical protein